MTPWRWIWSHPLGAIPARVPAGRARTGCSTRLRAPLVTCGVPVVPVFPVTIGRDASVRRTLGAAKNSDPVARSATGGKAGVPCLQRERHCA